MTQLNRNDRVRGCLLGLAIGDALGAPLEGLSDRQIRAHYGQVDNFVDGSLAWKRKPYRWRMPGLYSDDTQQALALTDVLLACGAMDLTRLAAIYLGMAQPRGSYVGAHRGVGRSFRQVIEGLEAGQSPERTGQKSAGIGAAMRIAPVALYFDDDDDAAFRAAAAASLMTHRDVRSLAGASAVVHAVRMILRGEPRSALLPFHLAQAVANDEDRYRKEYPDLIQSGGYGGSVPTAIARVEGLLERPRERALAALVEEANRHGADPVCKRPTMGFPPACIPTCLYLFLTTDSFEEALVEVVNLGGDADSAGAILGALAGAYYGVEAIPDRWLDRLQNRRNIDARAEALDKKSAAGITIGDLVDGERALTNQEAAYRESLLPHTQNGGDLGVNRRF